MTSFMIGDAVRRHPHVAAFDFPGFNPAAYEQQVIDEFDQLYEEGARRRRLMVIGLHERLSGHPSRVRVLDRVFTRLRERTGVWWARKDEVARYAIEHADQVAWVDRDAPRAHRPGPVHVLAHRRRALAARSRRSVVHRQHTAAGPSAGHRRAGQTLAPTASSKTGTWKTT